MKFQLKRLKLGGLPLLGVLMFALSSCQPAPHAETWAFCGLRSTDPNFAAKAKAFKDSGIDATFGPCLPAAADYSSASGSGRYDTPEGYMGTLYRNAGAGLMTIVYDARLWSSDQAVQDAGIAYWLPVKEWIRAIDLGDEYDEHEREEYLLPRWNAILARVTPVLGARPYTNMLGGYEPIGWAIDNLSGVAQGDSFLSFDNYDVPSGAIPLASFANERAAIVMCSISVTPDIPGLQQNTPVLPPTDIGFTIADNMMKLRGAGCDAFLVFNGGDAYGTPPFTGARTIHGGAPKFAVNSWGISLKVGEGIAP